MSDITFTGNKMLKSINKEWCSKYPYIYLSFSNAEGKVTGKWDVTHSSMRAKKAATELSTNAGMKVATFEKRYMDAYGSKVEIKYEKNGRLYRSLGDHDDMTLNQFNDWCKEKGASDVLKTHPEWF